jgi:hypothetical protein
VLRGVARFKTLCGIPWLEKNHDHMKKSIPDLILVAACSSPPKKAGADSAFIRRQLLIQQLIVSEL